MTPRELIMRHEGKRLFPYQDTVGKMTIGYGRNLDDIGISESEALTLLDGDIERAYDTCEKYPWFGALSEARKAAMINLAFNLGPNRLAAFKRFLSAMAAADWESAGNELIFSKWFKQVGRRGKEIVALVKTETWPNGDT